MASFNALPILLCLAFAGLVDAGCDTTKATKAASDCATGASKCATDGGSDICKVSKCSVDSLDCMNVAYQDADCCKDMDAAFTAAKKAWDDAIEANKDYYKDCTDDQIKWDGKCGSSGGAADAAVRAFPGLLLLAVAVKAVLA